MSGETLGDRLKAARKAKKLRNEALAVAAGVHVKTISQWIGGRQHPQQQSLEALAELLDVEVAWLQYGTGPRNAAALGEGDFQAGVNWAIDRLHRVAEDLRIEAQQRDGAPTAGKRYDGAKDLRQPPQRQRRPS